MANEPVLNNLSPEFLRRIGEGRALSSFFELSSEDKKQLVPRLSVWVETLTTLAQAWMLVGAKPTRRWAVFLAVDGVNTIHAPAADALPPTQSLEVQWERATVLNDGGERVPETRPGWEGHAGIANLDKGNKTQRKSLQWQLADLATVRILSDAEVVPP